MAIGRRNLMYFDRDDVRGLIRFSGVIALIVSGAFFLQVFGRQGGFRKDRATGVVYTAPDRPPEQSYFPHALGAGLLGIILLSVSTSGGSRSKQEADQVSHSERP